MSGSSDKFAAFFHISNSKGVIIPVDVVIEITPQAAIPLTCDPTGPVVFSGQEGDVITANFDLNGPGVADTISTTIIGTPGADLIPGIPGGPLTNFPYIFQYTIPAGAPDGIDLLFTLLWQQGPQTCAQSVTINVCTDSDGDTGT